MRLSSREFYGLAALTELARHGGPGPLAACQIASARSIPPRYLEQVLAALRRGGLVRSVRGTRGGYRLAAPAASITLADVIHVLEGGVERSERGEGGDGQAAAVWYSLQRRLCRALAQITLADVTADPEAVHRFLDADEFEPVDTAAKRSLA